MRMTRYLLGYGMLAGGAFTGGRLCACHQVPYGILLAAGVMVASFMIVASRRTARRPGRSPP